MNYRDNMHIAQHFFLFFSFKLFPYMYLSIVMYRLSLKMAYLMLKVEVLLKKIKCGFEFNKNVKYSRKFCVVQISQ